ncbi:unnamed protein product [Amoebophrya sp. A25]|nr:unnamed protein product [Amoebophrya sp. A25]|eukprot:GSA25T00024856001.1
MMLGEMAAQEDSAAMTPEQWYLAQQQMAQQQYMQQQQYLAAQQQQQYEQYMQQQYMQQPYASPEPTQQLTAQKQQLVDPTTAQQYMQQQSQLPQQQYFGGSQQLGSQQLGVGSLPQQQYVPQQQAGIVQQPEQAVSNMLVNSYAPQSSPAVQPSSPISQPLASPTQAMSAPKSSGGSKEAQSASLLHTSQTAETSQEAEEQAWEGGGESELPSHALTLSSSSGFRSTTSGGEISNVSFSFIQEKQTPEASASSNPVTPLSKAEVDKGCLEQADPNAESFSATIEGPKRFVSRLKVRNRVENPEYLNSAQLFVDGKLEAAWQGASSKGTFVPIEREASTFEFRSAKKGTPVNICSVKPYVSAPRYRGVGCFSDFFTGTQRSLPVSKGRQVKVETCALLCHGPQDDLPEYEFFGLQNGGDCYCGSLAPSSRVTAGFCNKPCAPADQNSADAATGVKKGVGSDQMVALATGASMAPCGGDMHSSLYQIALPRRAREALAPEKDIDTLQTRRGTLRKVVRNLQRQLSLTGGQKMENSDDVATERREAYLPTAPVEGPKYLPGYNTDS